MPGAVFRMRGVSKVCHCSTSFGGLDTPTSGEVHYLNHLIPSRTAVITHNAAIALMAGRVTHISSGAIAEAAAQHNQSRASRTSPGDAMTPLNTRLLRDIVHMKGQVIAGGLVVMCGVATYITMFSPCHALLRTKTEYCQQYRFAGLFAAAKRAPGSMAARIREIPGVDAMLMCPASPSRPPDASSPYL
jgi:hypothetical protein